MAYPKEKIERNRLTLQITRDSFVKILNGKQKTETRPLWPNMISRYMYWEGEPYAPDTEMVYIKYKELYLINGRRKDAPRLTVEILDVDGYYEVDENNEPLTYEKGGYTYVLEYVEYKLGKVIDTENCEGLL